MNYIFGKFIGSFPLGESKRENNAPNKWAPLLSVELFTFSDIKSVFRVPFLFAFTFTQWERGPQKSVFILVEHI